ncbi:MAG: DUF4185 domain-containing protein, partial [Actinobacteria bacterium]|nr:DUF4185 domain-containing protein [Actinomycetota bacterium]
PMVVDGGNLNVFARRVRSTSDRPQGFEVLGIDLAVLRLPAGGDPAFAGFRPTPSSGRLGVEGALTWGSGAVGYGPHVYVYGVRRSGVRRALYLARVPSGHLGRPRAWRFWNGSGYGRSEEDAVPVAAPNVDEAFSVHVVAGTWTIVSKDGTFGDTVQMLTGSQPHGPFHPSPLFDAPWNQTTSTYLAMYHGHISFLNRAHPVSVSRSPRRGSLPLLFEHPELYRPLWRPAPGAGEGVWLYPATGPMG